MVSTPFDPRTFVGTWSAHVPGESLDAIVQVGFSLSLWRSGVLARFDYLLDEAGQLLVRAPATGAIPSWLAGAVRIEADGAALMLTGASGDVVARLVPAPELAATIPPRDAEMEFDSWLSDQLAPREFSIPAGFAPVTHALLTSRRWFPAHAHPDNPDGAWVDFGADRTWVASDGCNTTRGLWLMTPAGSLRTTSGPSTLMACPGVPVPYWVSVGAGIAARADGTVVVLARDGTALGELIRGA